MTVHCPSHRFGSRSLSLGPEDAGSRSFFGLINSASSPSMLVMVVSMSYK